MTALDTAEALAADRCADLHGRETACLACRRAVGEELVRAMERPGFDFRGRPIYDGTGAGDE